VVPSKLYEYLSYNRPVLIAGRDSGGVASFLSDLEHPDVIAEDADRIAERLRSALDGNLAGYFQTVECGAMPLNEDALGRQYVEWLENAALPVGSPIEDSVPRNAGNISTALSES
jgi:hypothetical protein